MNIITYLINLDGSDQRLEQASEQLNRLNIPFSRVSAFDGRQLDPKSVAEYDQAHAISYMGRVLNGGELGCYFSHLDCARRFLATDAQYAIVLEDDMQLATDTSDVIAQALAWLEQRKMDWYLLHIGANKRKIYTTLTKISGRELMHAHYFPMTTTGLVWSRQGAQAFINEHSTIFAPVDNYLRWWLTKNNKGLSIWPPLVTTTGAQSEIDGRTVKRKSGGRSKMYGITKQRRLWSDKFVALFHKYIR